MVDVGESFAGVVEVEVDVDAYAEGVCFECFVVVRGELQGAVGVVEGAGGV